MNVEQNWMTVAPQVNVYGMFKRAKIQGIPRHGRYTGKGRMTLTNDGVHITARRVHKCAIGVMAPFVLLFCINIITLITGYIICISKHYESKASEILSQGGTRVLVLAIITFAIWHLMTKRENLFWPYAQLRHFAVNQQKHIIALDFNTPDKYTPMAIKCYNWQEVAQMLRQYAPQCEIPSGQ